MKNNLLKAFAWLAASVLMLSCSEEENYSASNNAVVTAITTGDASATAISATVYGTVQDLSKMAPSTYQVGAVYGDMADPTNGGTRQIGSVDDQGNVITSLSGLSEGATYYYATFVTLQSKVTRYGEVKSFVATDAEVATLQASGITACTAVLNGQASGIEDILPFSAVGFKYALSADGVASGIDAPVDETAATFSFKAEALLPSTTYYYAAYTKVGDGIILGNVQSFTTAGQTMEYVDLGLSVMWAKYNIGAEKETDGGIMVGFGDQTFYNHSVSNNDYTPWDCSGTDEDIVYNLQIDGNAVMKSQTPTVAQIDELFANTKQEAAETDGVKGIRFTARNGNSIFLPVTGYREGDDVTTDGAGYYWTGQVNEVNEDFAKILKVDVQNASISISQRHLGHAVRTVRQPDPLPFVDVDVNKLAVGDIEGNGRIRIEIFNTWGSTVNDPGINVNSIKFEKNMLVRFKITGITDNLVEGAPGSFVAGLEYADADWGPSLWSDFKQKYDAHISGDGEYTLWMESGGLTEGAIVFCVDIDQLGANLVDASKVKVESLQLLFDVEDKDIQYQGIDNSKIFFNNKDGNGVDGRIEIFNEWGATKGAGADYSDLKFGASTMLVEFTISGIDGNLVDGAEKTYKTELSFANQSWGVQYWGGNDHAATTVTGDGTYQVWAPLTGEVNDGPIVWTIELYGLWKDLADGEKVKATIDKVIIPGKK